MRATNMTPTRPADHGRNRSHGPAAGRAAAPSTDKVVWQNGVWVIRDTVTGRAYGPFSLRRMAEEELAKGRIIGAPVAARRVR